METGESIYEKVYASPRPPPKISFKDNWMKELGSEVAGHSESSQQTQPKTTNPTVRTGRLVSTEQPSSSSAQEIDKRFLLGCESTNVSVERSDKDKDADENVDADRVGTGRPVGSEQSLDLFTQREETDVDFRVSGLPHAVVKQAENFRVRELVKKIERHPHRQALQADLQRSNAYNPFGEKSKKMIRDMGNVELFELCETIPKVQCSECLLYWHQGTVYCTCGRLLRESESSRHLHQWRLDVLSQSRTTSSRRDDLMVLGTAKLKHRRSTSWSTVQGRDVSKRILQEFTIAFRRTYDIVMRNSKLVEVHRDGRVGTERFHLSPTDSFLPVSQMAFVVFFIQYIMVAVERPLVKLINSSTSIPSELVERAASQNRATC